MILYEPVFDEFRNLVAIFLLYVLQGIPVGLTTAMPLILQSSHHKAIYRQQGNFSLCWWPYSLKILWAPFIDAVFLPRFGRRKSWIIPTQIMIGIILFIIADRNDYWMGRPQGDSWGTPSNDHEVMIWPLTLVWFMLNVCAATQEAVVDAVGISILLPKNVTLAATCNFWGQSFGFLIAFASAFLLESPEICNEYIRSVPVPGQGLISFSGILVFWGAIYIISTIIIAILVRERRSKSPPKNKPAKINADISTEAEEDGNGFLKMENNPTEFLSEPKILVMHSRDFRLPVLNTYKVMWRIIRLKSILLYAEWIFHTTFVFAAPEVLFHLKLVDNGISKENLAMISVLVAPVQMAATSLFNRHIQTSNPLATSLLAAIPRTILGILVLPFIYFSPTFRYSRTSDSGSEFYAFSTTFYIGLVFLLTFKSLFSNVMFLSRTAFNAHISDPAVGATYMTLLITMSYLVGSFLETLALFLVDPLTVEKCMVSEKNELTNDTQLTKLFLCASQFDEKRCKEMSGSCDTLIDGFYVEVTASILIGLVLFKLRVWPLTRKLGAMDVSEFRVKLQKYAQAN